ncbi:MAG: hypothetical protein ACFB4I_09685 [Cyanophyceae cyanobacterium]
MSASSPLNGLDLVDCAKANAKQGVEVAAKQCGYGPDINSFKQNLKQACQNMGIQISELSDLITDQQVVRDRGGLEISPESQSDL